MEAESGNIRDRLIVDRDDDVLDAQAGLSGRTSRLHIRDHRAPLLRQIETGGERRRDRLQQDADLAGVQVAVASQLRIRAIATSALGIAKPRPWLPPLSDRMKVLM